MAKLTDENASGVRESLSLYSSCSWWSDNRGSPTLAIRGLANSTVLMY